MKAWPFERAPFDVAKRVALWLATGLTGIAGYGLAKLEPFGPPIELPLTALDLAIPFLPWTIWPYGTITWACLLCWLMVPDRWEARRLYFSMVLACVVCWTFFAFFPTTYPRHLYPLPDLATATIREFAELRQSDTPANCLPSMHVALAWSMGLTWAFFLKRPWARALPILWAITVSVCTLTTKQHYLIDVPTGMAVGIGAWWIVRRGVYPGVPDFWTRHDQPLRLTREQDLRAAAALRQRVEAHQWSLSDIPWPKGPLDPLDPLMVRLVNQVIYIEEIAGLNFQLLRDASADDDLRALYAAFADEERRHADGLRKVLRLHGAPLERPGLGNALVLDQFDTLDPRSDADAILVAVSTPVFETFLDAGTIPFLQAHPALQSPAFDAFVERVCRDEGAHIALNVLLTREAARRYRGLRGLRLMFNPAIYRGMVAVPWMSLDVYSLAHQLGYDFATLLPAFGRLWRMHRRYPELAGFPLWWSYRLFVLCGTVATVVTLALVRARLLFGSFWVHFTRGTDLLAHALFGDKLLARRDLPGNRLRASDFRLQVGRILQERRPPA